MKRRNKMKLFTFLTTLSILGIAGIGIVKANSQKFVVSLKYNGYKSSPRFTYTEGTFFVDMPFDAWYVSSCNSGKINITLYDQSIKSLSSFTTKITIGSSIYRKMGYHKGGVYYFDFYAQSCGVVSNKTRVGT